MRNRTRLLNLLKDPNALRNVIRHKLATQINVASFWPDRGHSGRQPTSVLFLIGMHATEPGKGPVPCFIFNKRSQYVRQPGDLCFPGGHHKNNWDLWLARLLNFPGSPLFRWPFWATFRRQHPLAAKELSISLATSLRESFEEMRLNPLLISFLGPMPPERLVMFRQVIYPVVGWIRHQKQFVLNHEVDRLVCIPIRAFFQQHWYGRYRLSYSSPLERRLNWDGFEEFPCFLYPKDHQADMLWGATYRMVIRFLNLVFDHEPPALHELPAVSGKLGRKYFTGQGNRM